MGLSPGPEWLVSHDQTLDVISQFIDAIAPAQRIVIAGHSYGASLTRGLMQRHGDRIAGVLLLSPGEPRPTPERRQRQD